MNFQIATAVEVLSATPSTLKIMLGGLSDAWVGGNDRDQWQPVDVVGHLIHGEETDWIPRAKIILEQGTDRTFQPFDRFAQFQRFEGKTLTELLDEFARQRAASIQQLLSWNLGPEQLRLEGMHPELGTVTLEQLLATWVVHDLNHVSQIAKALSQKYSDEVGPWRAYLSVLN